VALPIITTWASMQFGSKRSTQLCCVGSRQLKVGVLIIYKVAIHGAYGLV
jgi:hypothetical protein